MKTFGPTYRTEYDKQRLKSQFKTIKKVMLENDWLTLFEIKQKTGYPESSISAQLRHLRKPKFWDDMKYDVVKRRRIIQEGFYGTWEYKLVSFPRDEVKAIQENLL